MRVLISGYVGKKITGIGRFVESILNNVSDENQYILYVNYDIINNFEINRHNVTIKPYFISKNNSLLNLIFITFFFPIISIVERVDIVVLPNFSWLLYKFKKTIVVVHDLIEFNVENKFSRLKMFYRKKIADKSMVYNSDFIITVSENSKKDIVKFFKINPDKIDIVYPSIDKNKLIKIDLDESKIILKKHGLNSNYILYVGTIDYPGKNSINLIKAFEILKKENKYDGDLYIVGMKGKGSNYIYDYIEHSIYKNNIILPGYVDDTELAALYTCCDIFCFLSFYEGFGIPPLEALYYNAKVLVSNNSSLPEVVGDAGFLVSPYDITLIKNKIYEILKIDKDKSFYKKVFMQTKVYDCTAQTIKFEKILKKVLD